MSTNQNTSQNQTQKEKEAEKALKIALLDLGYGFKILSFLSFHLTFFLLFSFFVFLFLLKVESMRGIYDVILEEFPPDFGKAISKKEREERQLFVSTLIYGEIDFDSFGIFIIHLFLNSSISYSIFKV